MDLWDLTKLMFRRWPVALPMLALTAAAGAWVALEVQPDYKASGHLQLIPPAVSPEDAAKTGRPRNPWSTLGVDALGQASVIKVQEQQVLEQMKAQGHTDNFTITSEYNSPIFTIEAVAETRQKAAGTVLELIRRLDQAVKEQQQQQYQVAQEDSITTYDFNGAVNVEEETLKVQRALIVIVGIGLLLTAAATVGMDTLLRRRTAARATPNSASAGGTASPDAPTPAQPETAAQVGPPVAAIPTAAPPSAVPVAAAPGVSFALVPISPAVPPAAPAVPVSSPVPPPGPEAAPAAVGHHGTVFRSARAGQQQMPDQREPAGTNGHGSVPQRAMIPVEYLQPVTGTGSAPANAGPNTSEPNSTLANPLDATIVLPLSGNSWLADDGKTKHR